MSITVTPTHPDFVTEISGVDLARPLNPADRGAIEQAINRYSIVVFHDQTLTDDQFSRLKDEMDAVYTGSRNAGRPLLLDSALEWVQMLFF